MSEASKQLERKSEGDVPTANEVIAATAKEAGETLRKHQDHLQAAIRSDPLRAAGFAAGVGFIAALVLRRL
jgi:hypothetical protein